MKTIIINGQEYKYEAVFVTKKAVNGNIGVVIQLQVFKDGKQLDKKDFSGYVAEKIEEHIRECL
ncbi:hypothetical protein [Aliarcobacter butzleri]|uniref:hypothetical protein n=1 Tax=Aliarcobacter butzleri TaxID=28197 RepID=UPI0012F9120C|nr:hypothetical protein [Aliarcobacter butzleri]